MSAPFARLRIISQGQSENLGRAINLLLILDCGKDSVAGRAHGSNLHWPYFSGIKRGARLPTIVVHTRLAKTLQVTVEQLEMSRE